MCELVSPDETTTQRATVFAVDIADGSRRWNHEVDIAVAENLDGVAPALTAPAVADGTVYVGVAPEWTFSQLPVPDAGYLVALDADTETVQWRHDVGLVPRTLAVAGDCCYVTDIEGNLVVVR
ncbi:outer membrane protein assembly factor BamB family protein [Haloplanus aerogenes]|uniref:outer membrane protein assembly factor BamB family protein n=1 Tax=Haloplanus aerogenes TaxID=660522 RepID=UPI001314B426|nr:PQQ-binding-like beta-propeller repeat protein [Haloplanus aerogenes]